MTLVVGFMSLLDVTIVNVALPSIQRGIDASPQGLQWVISGYALTFGLVLVAGGRLGDIVGRRRMFLIGLAGFTATSALAGAAPNEELLVAARLLQGVAAGMLTPQNTGLIQELFRGEERGRAFGVFGTTVGVSAATGPVLGGLIIALAGPEDGWRFVFLVNVPIGLAAMVLAARLIPRSRPVEGSVGRQLDPVGALLLGATVLSVLLPLVQSMSDPVSSWWLMVLLAPALAWAFTRWERHMIALDRSPLLDVRLVARAPGFATGVALQTVYFCGFSGLWLVLALFFQDGLGYSPLQSGLAVTPFAIGSAGTAVVAGRLVGRWGRRLTVTGLVLVTGGFTALALTITAGEHTALSTAVPLLVAGIGSGAVISPNITMTLTEVPPRMGGAAGGAIQTGARVGSAVGAAVLAAAFRISVEGLGYAGAAQAALVCAIGFVLVALALALWELRLQRRREW
ncbi:MAG TPA: MFS transporter [Nocardioidaceae bacterium]|nr:MFS transporter [Nocardioidaceae bacterium]